MAATGANGRALSFRGGGAGDSKGDDAVWNYADLNWIAILAVTLLGFLIGGLWYGPLFGRAWLKEVDLTEEQIKAAMQGASPFVVSFVAAVVTAVVMSVLIATLNLASAGDGVVLGLFVGVGFIATGMGADMAFRNDSARLWMIQSGCRVVYCALMGMILAVWK